jgi:hypothetical protein
MPLRVAVRLCALIFIASISSGGYAQERPSELVTPPPAISGDEAVATVLRERKRGIVIIDAAGCGAPTINVGRMVDGKMRKFSIPATSYFFGTRTRLGGLKVLEPGEYSVLSVQCQSPRAVFNGPFARFSVAAGEIVNVGVLKFDYKLEGFFVQTGTMHKAVVGPSAETLAGIKKRIPTSFGGIVNRPMTLIGSADVGIKSR